MKFCGVLIFITTVIVPIFMADLNEIERRLFAIGNDCKTNSDCSYISSCYRGKCINICYLEQNILGRSSCAKNAYCLVYVPHTSACECYPQYFGDPYTSGCQSQFSDFENS